MCNWGERATGATRLFREGAESRLRVGVDQAVLIVLWGLRRRRRHSVELDHGRGDSRRAIAGTDGRRYRLQRQERHRLQWGLGGERRPGWSVEACGRRVCFERGPAVRAGCSPEPRRSSHVRRGGPAMQHAVGIFDVLLCGGADRRSVTRRSYRVRGKGAKPRNQRRKRHDEEGPGSLHPGARVLDRGDFRPPRFGWDAVLVSFEL